MEPPGKVVHLEIAEKTEKEKQEQRLAGGCEGHGRRFICKYLLANDYLSQGETLKKKKSYPDKIKEPSASQGFGQRDLLQLCPVESATWRLFYSAKAGE